MKLLLSIMTAMSSGIVPISNIKNTTVLSIDKNMNSNTGKEDISKININIKDIDITNLNNGSYTIGDIEDSIAGTLLSLEQSEEATDLLVALLTHDKSIKVIGVPRVLPEKGKSTTYDIKLIAISGNYKIGSTIEMKLKFVNRSAKIDINDIIKVKDLGKFNILDVSEELIIKQALSLNKLNLKIKELQVLYFGNSYATLSFTNGNDYCGVVDVSYIINPIINESGEFLKTGKASADAYDSTQEAYENTSENITFKLDKNQITKSFNKISLKIDGEAWNNGNGTKKNIIGKKEFRLYGDTNKTNIYYDHYDGTNYDKEYAYIWLRWTDNYNLEISLQSYVKTYATAWNAYWAKATMQIWITRVELK